MNLTKISAPLPPANLSKVKISILETECAKALDDLKNKHAKGRDYGTPTISPMASVRSKAGYPGPFQEEALKFVAWEDQCQIKAYQILDDVLSGKRQPPASTDAFLAELPTLVW